MIQKFIRQILILILFTVFLMVAGCSKKDEPISDTGFYFDTVISVSIYDKSDPNILAGCFELAKTYDNLFSKTIEGSDIWNINHSKGAPVSVQNDTIILLEKFLDYASLSQGIVDPTVGALSALWDFSEDSEQNIPMESDLKKACSHVNYKNIVIDSNHKTVMLTDSNIQIDLGCIAKGFIADKMKAYLLSEGVASALINLGGNILLVGAKPGGAPFTIGIQKPFDITGSAALTLELSDCSVVSSGIYERFFEKDGTYYHHILDTKTGYPIQNGLTSVTIISDSSVDGDALSTLCFALGLEDGRHMIESLDNIGAVFITTDGTQYPVNISLPSNYSK